MEASSIKRTAFQNKTKKNLTAWLIMTPSLIVFAFFVWVPLIEVIRMSFFDAVGYTTTDFVGFKNYINVINNPTFSHAIKNTVLYTLWSLIIGFFVPIIMAALISETVHLKGLFRVGVYFPNIIPGLAAVLILRFFFNPGETGVLNILLSKIGIGPLPWLTDPNWTIPLIIISMTWKAAGNTALIYMANISNINSEMFEAATIDGASPFRRFWSITLPSLLSLGRTLLILQIVSVFQILYEPLMLTNGGPNNASVSVMQLVYRFAFDEFKYPMASALSALICVILGIFTIIYFALTKKVND